MIFIKKRSEPRALSDARRVLRQTPDVVCNYDNLPPRTRRDIVGSSLPSKERYAPTVCVGFRYKMRASSTIW